MAKNTQNQESKIGALMQEIQKYPTQRPEQREGYSSCANIRPQYLHNIPDFSIKNKMKSMPTRLTRLTALQVDPQAVKRFHACGK